MIKTRVELTEYLVKMHPHLNKTLDFGVVLKPFGIHYDGPKSSTLLVGHLVDYLWFEYEPQTKPDLTIDIVDIISALVDLDYKPAYKFINEPHYLNSLFI